MLAASSHPPVPVKAGAAVVLAVVLVAACSSGTSKKAASTSTPASSTSTSAGQSPEVAPLGPGQLPAEGVAVSATPTTHLLRLAGWGWNGYGQVGDGTVCDQPKAGDNCVRPAPVGLTGAVPFTASAMAAGGQHNLTVMGTGTAFSWGRNLEAEVGIGQAGPPVTRPRQVEGALNAPALNNVTVLGAGDGTSFAVSDNTVFAWGSNIWGQLGVGTSTGPQHCPRPGGSGPSSGPTTTAARPGTSDACATRPTQVLGSNGRPFTAQALSGGETHTAAISGGTVWTWGSNDLGQLGIGTRNGPQQCEPFSGAIVPCSTKPVQVVGPNGQGVLSDVKAVAAGANFTVALRRDGTVWAWGSDQFAGLGQPNQSGLETCSGPFNPSGPFCSTKPVQVSGPGGRGFLTDVKAISMSGSDSGFHVLALKTDGTVWAWGADNDGELGNGQSVPFVNAPVQVLGPGGAGTLGGIADIAAGGKFSLALKTDGTLWSWGSNRFGQLGTNTTSGPQQCTAAQDPCSKTPVQVAGIGGTGQLGGVVAVAAGDLSAVVEYRP